jgi:hypothetical protein
MPLRTITDVGHGSVDPAVADDNANGSDQRVLGQWASYVGGAGDDALCDITLLGTGSVSAMYAVGWTTDQADGQTTQLKVIRTRYDSADAPKVYVTPSSPGNDSRGFAIDITKTEGLRSSGSVIVGGYRTVNGVQHMLIQSFKSDLDTVNWTVTSTQPSVVYGLKASSPGGAIYFTGSSNGNLLVGKLDVATGSVIYSNTFSFTDRRGRPMDSVGNGIGVDSAGRASVAMKFTSLSGNELPGFAQVQQDGQAVVAHSYDSIGAGGSLNSVLVDGNGNAFYTGSTYGRKATYDGYSYLMMNKIAPDGQTQLYSYLYSFRNQLGQHTYNWVGNDIELDNSGSAIMATTVDDGANLDDSYGQWIFKVDAGSGTKLDHGDGGFNGAKNEYAEGLAVDFSGNVWAVGKTDSPDLPVNGFQTTYAGDPHDGWIARFDDE